MNLNNGSYQTELDNFFKVINHLEVAERIVYKGALSKARKKLKYEAFVELNNSMNTKYYSNFSTQTWHGFNLVAVDGTTARVPDEHEIVEHFGFWNVTKGDRCPKARASQLFDVLNKITLDAIISPKAEGERELAAYHFLKLMPTDLVLLDRGYPAFWLFKLILSMDANFCARISCTKWKQIRKFYRSGEDQRIIKIAPPPSSFLKCAELGLDKKPIKNLAAIIANTVKDDVRKISERCKYKLQVNFAQAISKMKNTIAILFVRSKQTARNLVSKLQEIFIKTLERIRPGRKNKRNHKVKVKKYHFAYKPVC